MQIHVARGQQQLGVFSPEEVSARLASGELLPSDFGWAEGQADWIPLSSFPGLSVAPSPVNRGPSPAGIGAPAAAARMAGPIPEPAGPPPTSAAAVASLICGLL